MLFLSFCWLFATLAICLGFLLVSSRSFVPKFISNLYLFGKVRDLDNYKLPLKRTSFIQVPKSWFSHFYFAGILCNSLVLFSTLNTYLYSGLWSQPMRQIMQVLGCSEDHGGMSPVSVLLALVMLEIQVVRRFLECVFVNSYSGSTMSIVIYSVGVMFYSFVGISTLCQAQVGQLTLETFSVHWYHIAAVAMFTWASYKQNKVNNIFAKLRQNKSGKVENDRHHIPHGDLFELCSCPHYLMEIIIYTSLNVLFIGQHQILLCLWTFVASNQFISAYFVHLWYKERFLNYPKDRKALIPFLF